MRKNILIGILILALVFTGWGAWGKAELKSEITNFKGELNEYQLELETWREFKEVGPGFYSVTTQEISRFVYFLAGPACQGRQNGTDGNRIAGEFLMTELESYFLDQHLFQNFHFSEVKNPHYSLPLITEGFKRAGFDVNIEGRNIIGILEGTEKREECLVICAHYDHVGWQKGEVHPGADDNASGTAAVLEIAEAFGILAEDGVRPKRSIIFALFDAEEWGLWGSQYFVENPLVSFKDIVAVINLDMIGRNDPQKLEVLGSKKIKDFPERSPQLHRATIQANKILGFELVYPPAWADSHKEYVFFLSDQASFFMASPKDNRLPVVFYHTGLHEDYHTPQDMADKINFEKVRNVARFTFFVAWQIANLEERPVYQD